MKIKGQMCNIYEDLLAGNGVEDIYMYVFSYKKKSLI